MVSKTKKFLFEEENLVTLRDEADEGATEVDVLDEADPVAEVADVPNEEVKNDTSPEPNFQEAQKRAARYAGVGGRFQAVGGGLKVPVSS